MNAETANPTTALAPSWKVLPHDRLIRIEENILTVTGTIHVPMELPRRMTVVRLRDSRVIVFSAIALDDTQMQVLEEFGPPTFLVVPSDKHRLDAKAWKERYPSMQVIASEGSREGVAKQVHVDTTTPTFDDPNVQFATVPGTRGHEAALIVRSLSGITLVLNDIVGNIRSETGFGGWFLRLMGFAGDEPHIPKPVKLMMIADKEALHDQLMRWAALESLKRILVSHGEPIDENPKQALQKLADSLK